VVVSVDIVTVCVSAGVEDILFTGSVDHVMSVRLIRVVEVFIFHSLYRFQHLQRAQTLERQWMT